MGAKLCLPLFLRNLASFGYYNFRNLFLSLFDIQTIVLEPCQFTSYNTETISYDRNSIMAQGVLKKWFNMANMTFDTMDNRTILFFNYPSMDVEVSQKVQILDASSFISAVGGNLGLFIGFSFLDTLFAVYKWLCNRFTK